MCDVLLGIQRVGIPRYRIINVNQPKPRLPGAVLIGHTGKDRPLGTRAPFGVAVHLGHFPRLIDVSTIRQRLGVLENLLCRVRLSCNQPAAHFF